MGKALYQEGVDKLLKTVFISPGDTLDSLKAVINRSFRELSIKILDSVCRDISLRVVLEKRKL